eukprot:403341406
MRSYQRDEEYKQLIRFMLLESLETLINYRTIAKYDSEIKMGSDFVYYLLTYLIGKQTLGEEYCSILPICQKNNKFPSPLKRTLDVFLKVFGSFIINKQLKKFDTVLQIFVDKQNESLREKIKNDGFKLKFFDIVKVQMVNLLPSAYSTFVKNFDQLYLTQFFLWGKYYDVSKRLLKIRYKYVPGNESDHTISYINPGRFIMFAFVIQGLYFVFKIIKVFYTSYKLQQRHFKKLKENQQKLQKNANPQEDSDPLNQENNNSQDNQSQNDQSEENQCPLCYGARINTTATVCGHLFCWDCIHTSIKIKQECPQCREPCVPQKLVLVYNF